MVLIISNLLCYTYFNPNMACFFEKYVLLLVRYPIPYIIFSSVMTISSVKLIRFLPVLDLTSTKNTFLNLLWVKMFAHVFPWIDSTLEINVSANQFPRSLVQCWCKLLTHNLLFSGFIVLRTTYCVKANNIYFSVFKPIFYLLDRYSWLNLECM